MKRLRIFLLLIILFHLGWGQNTSNIVLSIPGDAIVAANGTINIKDSSVTALALGQVQVNGTAYWLKKSNHPPKQTNVIHYWFDNSTKTLIVYFSPGDFNNLRGHNVSVEIVGIKGALTLPLDVRGQDGRPISTSQ